VTVSEEIPKAPSAPARARRLLDPLEGQIPPGRLEDARLLVSELVTNAVEHVPAEGPIRVEIECQKGRLRVDVIDPGFGFTVPQGRDPAGDRGWGLEFVRLLSDRWGVGDGDGASVWFELTA
jgi:anti-sigma regulatory factor (Ser/Thr protein kinase)